MPNLQPQSVSLATHDSRLRVEFRWQCDRFVHAVFVDEVEAGTSVEGSENDSWPPSPPIQQLSLEQINGSSAILGVGAAGRSHWSISVELDRDGEAGLIKFDLACRCKDELGFLGSTYRLADSIVLTSSDSNPVIRGQTVAIPPATQEANTHRWQYRMTAARSR